MENYRVGRALVARYQTTCAWCGGEIYPGAPIWRDESFRWIHLQPCAEKNAPIEAEAEIGKAIKQLRPKGRRRRVR